MRLIRSNNPSHPTATTQLRACLSKVIRFLRLKKQFISHKSSFSWTHTINTLVACSHSGNKKKHCKTACLLSPKKKWGDPFNLVWLPSRSTMWNCFGWLQQGPLLTSASPLCVHPCKRCDYCSTHEQVREQPAARQQLMHLPDSQAFGWQPPTRLGNTDA